jgi:signal peptide peptidase SppA
MEVDQEMKLATIPIIGLVGHRIGMLEKTCGVVDVRDIRNNVKAALDNPLVETIVFDVNSPGGTVTGVPELASYIAEAAKKKKCVAFTDTLMASAAYYLMAGVDEIIATPSADIGSVGVYQALLDVSQLYEDMGVKVELFKDGEYKAMGIEGIPLTDKQRELLQSEVNKISVMFKGFVKQYRKVSDETLQGQTFMGFDAAKNGLVDGIINDSDELFVNE